MNNQDYFSFNKIKINIFYVGLILLFIGLFWLLITGKSIIGFIIVFVGIILIGYITLHHVKDVKDAIIKINWKNFGVKSYYIFIILAVLIMVNVISNKRFLRWDITESKRYTLSPHTKDLLKQLDEGKTPIKILFFRSEAPLIQTVDDLLKEYKARCTVLEIEYINPDKEPQRAKEYNIRSISVPYGNYKIYGTMIMLSSGLRESLDVVKIDYRNAGGRYQPYLNLKENLEKDISSALLRMTKTKKKIYFVYGHGEVDLDNQDKDGWSETKNIIADENYTVDKIYLASIGEIPNDCDVLILGAPQKNFLSQEFQMIDRYLERGGHVLVLLEPMLKNNINQFLNAWGIQTSEKYVVDPGSSYWFQPIIPLVTEYSFHPITEKLRYATFFPTVTSVEIMNKKQEGIMVQPVAQTTPESWIESDVSSRQVKFNAGVDKKGPITIMVALNKKIEENKELRMVVIGDSDFAANSSVKSYGNMDMLLNTLNWLAGKEELIGIRSKPIETREIQLTQVKLNFILYSSVIILPLLIIIFGVVVWLRRR